MQVGDALVGVDHGQLRALGEALGDLGLDALAHIFGDVLEAAEDRGQAVVGGEAGGGQVLAVLGEQARTP